MNMLEDNNATGLLSVGTKEKLEEIIKHCFYCNRIADRIMSALSVRFVMPITVSILHPNLAHLYPILADEISDYMDARNCTVIYGETPVGNQNYETPKECFEKMLKLNLELETLTIEAIKYVENEKDYTTKVFLDSFLKELIPITASILLLVDKARLYGDEPSKWMDFDHDIEDFPLFGKED